MVKGYLLENFEIQSNGKKLDLNYLGYEMELKENVMWCYFEASKVRKFDGFTVKNKALVEKFSDQENIVHYNHPNGDIQSERAGKKKSVVEFESVD